MRVVIVQFTKLCIRNISSLFSPFALSKHRARALPASRCASNGYILEFFSDIMTHSTRLSTQRYRALLNPCSGRTGKIKCAWASEKYYTYIILFLSIVPLRALAVEDYGDRLNNAQAAYKLLDQGNKRAAVALMHEGARTSKAQDAFWNRVIDEATRHGNVPVAVVATEQKIKRAKIRNGFGIGTRASRRGCSRCLRGTRCICSGIIRDIIMA